MHTTRTNTSSTEIKLTITASEAELGPIKDQVVARLGKNVKVAGFRSGKAPATMIEKAIDQNVLQSDFLDEAMTQLYARATTQEKVRPVTRPDVVVKKFVPFTALEFEVSTSVIGKISLPDYRKIKVSKTTSVVSAKDIEGVIDSLRVRMADKNVVTRPAKLKDEVIIDFVGTGSDGKAIDNADGTDYPLLLGSKAFIPGFEDNVVGMKSDTKKTFELVFPKDYGATALAGKKVNFAVTAKTVNELTQPIVDDSFAAKVGPFKTVTELKADIKKQLLEERSRDAESQHQDAVLKAVSQKSTVEIPSALIEQQVTYNLDETKRNLTQRGLTLKEFLSNESKTEEEYKAELLPQSVEQLKASLVLAEIADLEKMTIEPEELEIRVKLLKGQYTDPQMQSELDKPENRRDIASRMLSEKVVHFLAEHATK